MYKVFNKVTGLNIMSSLSCGDYRVFSSFRKGYSHIVTKYLTTYYTTDSNMSKTEESLYLNFVATIPKLITVAVPIATLPSAIY